MTCSYRVAGTGGTESQISYFSLFFSESIIKCSNMQRTWQESAERDVLVFIKLQKFFDPNHGYS